MNNGCETNIANDPNNCGKCGHTCAGAGCNANICGQVPTLFAPAYDVPPIAVGGIAVDSSYVYWTAGNTVWRKASSNANGAAEKLNPNPMPGVGPCFGIAVDSSKIYFACEPGIYSMPLSGGMPPTQIADKSLEGYIHPLRVAIESTDVVYWTDRSVPSFCNIFKVTIGKPAPDTVNSSPDECQSDLVLGSTDIFWVQGNKVQARPKDLLKQPMPTTIVSSKMGAVTGFAVSENSIYYTTASDVHHYTTLDPLAGSDLIIKPFQSGIVGMALNGMSLYWFTANGQVIRSDLSGNNLFTLAAMGSPISAIAFGPTTMYIGMQGPAAIYSVPK